MRIMRERERIAMFTKLVQEYGVPDAATFPTESLHEKGALNLAQVCVCLRTLGIEVRHGLCSPIMQCIKQYKCSVNLLMELHLTATECHLP